MKFHRAFTYLLSLVFIVWGCASPVPNRRNPTSVMCKHSAHDPLGLDALAPKDPVRRVHRYKGLLKPPPLRYLATKVAQFGVKVYIKTLPLDPKVEERVLENLKSKKFAKDLVPFLIATMDLYSVGNKYEKQNFKRYISKKFRNEHVPGSEHTLFEFTPDKKLARIEKRKARKEKKKLSKEERKKDKSEMAQMIAAVVTIFDSLILMDPDFTLSEPPSRSLEVVDRVTPNVSKILEIVLKGMDPHSETYEAVHAIASNSLRVKAATASLIDAVHMYAYKHYQMFVGRYEHKEKMKAWLAKSSDEEIVKYFKDFKKRKYAVHVMVDGLQGTLMEALAKGDTKSPFLQKIYSDYKNYEDFKPKDVEVDELDDVGMRFFYNAMTTGGHFMKHKDYLPFFKNLYKNYDNSIAKQGVSTTPTISVRNIPIIQTGATVAGKGGTGLPNFHYVNREEDRAYYFFGNDSILLEQITKQAGMKTIADRLPHLNTLNCASTYESGFDWSIDPLLNLVLGESTRDFGEMLCIEELSKRIKNEKKIQKLHRRYIKIVEKGKKAKARRKKILRKVAELTNETMPEYLAYYNPWPDHFAHFKGPFGDEIISPTGELNRLDYWLMKITELYKEAGIYNKTFFAMAGDHGLAPVKYALNPEKAVFGSLQEEGYEMLINKISSDEGEGPKLSDHVNPPSQKINDIVVASTAGGNHMMDLFKEDRNQYKQQPVYSDLTQYKLLSGQVLNIPEEILARLGDSLDYMVLREEPSTLDYSKTRVMRRRGGQDQVAIITRDGNKIHYKSEADLLEVYSENYFSATKINKSDSSQKNALIKRCIDEAKEDDPSTWCNEDQWRDLTAFTPRPDSIVQLSRLYDTPLAGTINVFPARMVGFNTKVPGRHAGELFEEKDSFVGYWGKVNKAPGKLISEVNGSAAVSVYEYLSGKVVEPGKDGFGYRSLFERFREKKK